MWQLPALLFKSYIRVHISMLISQFPGKANSPMGQYWFLHQRTLACLLEWKGSSIPKRLEQAPKEHIDECYWAVCQNWCISPPLLCNTLTLSFLYISEHKPLNIQRNWITWKDNFPLYHTRMQSCKWCFHRFFYRKSKTGNSFR